MEMYNLLNYLRFTKETNKTAEIKACSHTYQSTQNKAFVVKPFIWQKSQITLGNVPDFHRITESFGLEKSFNTIEFNL